jgi:hypothetical protein
MSTGKSFDDFYQEAVQQFGTGGAEAPALAPSFDFCSIWPIAKQALQYLSTLVPFWAKLVIQALIKFGDQKCQ